VDAPAEKWVIVLVPEPGPVPPAVRVRQVLKYALRRQGLACEAVLADVPADVCPVELVEDAL
jgi:hypothetical protein